MGKLQYINRKIEGVKLGQVVAKDLRKRIPPGLGSKAALRDPVVELDVTNKSIDDEAAADICDALASSISNSAGTTKLEELKLKENSLTAKSLRPLAKVVKAAAHELRDLDLSHNNISIATSEDADAWEEFLVAFSRCFVMRRLDLSGNALGPKGFETLQKVYLREDLLGAGLEVRSDTSGGSVRSLSSDSLVEAVENTHLSDEGEESEAEASTPSVSKQTKPKDITPDRATAAKAMAQYSRTAGLRSIPYVCLFDCDMTDICAMYLSHVVEHHALVAELLPKVPPPKSGAQASQIEAYDMVPGCNGIIWKPNARLGKDGLRVLELSEQARINVAEDLDQEDGVTVSPMLIPRKVADTPSPFTPLTNRQRRVSMSSGQGSPDPITPGASALKANTLDAVRHRIQVEAIKDHGQRSNDLWRNAFRILAFARPVLSTIEAQMSPDDDTRDDDVGPLRSMAAPVPDTPTPLRKIPEDTPTDATTSSSPMWPLLPSAKSENTAPPSSKQAGKVFRLNTNRHGQSILEREQKLKLKVPEDKDAGKNIVRVDEVAPTPRRSPRLPRKQYRASLPFGLNEKVWGRIVAYAVGAGDALSPAQETQVIKYACDRRTLHDEYMRLGKLEQAQIWKVLEQMGCLAYA